jgi:hypothetical protein
MQIVALTFIFSPSPYLILSREVDAARPPIPLVPEFFACRFFTPLTEIFFDDCGLKAGHPWPTRLGSLEKYTILLQRDLIISKIHANRRIDILFIMNSLI